MSNRVNCPYCGSVMGIGQSFFGYMYQCPICQSHSPVCIKRDVCDVKAADRYIPKTEWIPVSNGLYACESCGQKVRLRCKFCPDCGRKATNSETEDEHDE